ncbi:MAG: putative aliphatic sulfonates transport permease protein SsuC [Alphaproteobacteria bacterium MarineAlpha2_Bin1]|nr:MAG: putative aliphatic sulfonates transport permease protein SsuC [Alphaproteobacteria bacterium MarineAlpha2_Bin1]
MKKKLFKNKISKSLFSFLVILPTIIIIWQLVIIFTGVPKYILPSPLEVFMEIKLKYDIIFFHFKITLLEIVIGIILGTLLGTISAMTIFLFKPARIWLLPLLVASQAIPVFAIAPLLVLWLGYGISSKIAMAILIIFFPVTANFLDGLKKTRQDWIQLAKIMANETKLSKYLIFRYIHIPAALPNLGSGLRVAAAVAPIGAIVGEWVGSGSGLGYLMLQSNAKFQINLMFASLIVIIFTSLIIYFSIDQIIKFLIRW